MTEAGSSPEPKERPQRVGMLIEKLDDEVFEKVISIYDKVFDSDASRYIYPGYVENVLEQLARGNYAEFRFGSKFSSDSKLEVIRSFRSETERKPIIYFDFYFNSPVHHSIKADIEKREDRFRREVDELLTKKGLAIPLER